MAVKDKGFQQLFLSHLVVKSRALLYGLIFLGIFHVNKVEELKNST